MRGTHRSAELLTRLAPCHRRRAWQRARSSAAPLRERPGQRRAGGPRLPAGPAVASCAPGKAARAPAARHCQMIANKCPALPRSPPRPERSRRPSLGECFPQASSKRIPCADSTASCSSALPAIPFFRLSCTQTREFWLPHVVKGLLKLGTVTHAKVFVLKLETR